MPGHDQLFKNLLESFLPDLLALMLPEVAAELEPESVKFLRDEHFLDPPDGARLQADLLAEVRLRSSPRRSILIHVEIERRWTSAMAHRLWRYNLAIRRRHRGAILTLAIFLRGGEGGVHRKTWRDASLGDLNLPTQLTFTYYTFALAGCQAEDYLKRPQPLAWALAALMQTDLPPEHHKLACFRRILHAPLHDGRRHTLLHCVDTYLPLNSRQERSFHAMLIEHEGYRIPDIYKTEPPWVERLKQETLAEGRKLGRREALDEGVERGMRRLITELLEERFGTLPQTATARLESMEIEQLTTLSRRLLTADSLDELGLA